MNANPAVSAPVSPPAIRGTRERTRKGTGGSSNTYAVTNINNMSKNFKVLYGYEIEMKYEKPLVPYNPFIEKECLQEYIDKYSEIIKKTLFLPRMI